MSERVEGLARALMLVSAPKPKGWPAGEFPVLCSDPDYDDLPDNHTEGTVDDEITKEAVLRLALAAISYMEECAAADCAKAIRHSAGARRWLRSFREGR